MSNPRGLHLATSKPYKYRCWMAGRLRNAIFRDRPRACQFRRDDSSSSVSLASCSWPPFSYGGMQQSREEKVPVEIVGVVRGYRRLQIHDCPGSAVLPSCGSRRVWTYPRLELAPPPTPPASSKRNATGNRSVDPRCRCSKQRTMVQQLEREQFLYRRGMVLLGGLGAVALLLAAVGLYSVVRFAVVKRAVEIGISDGARCAGK